MKSIGLIVSLSLVGQIQAQDDPITLERALALARSNRPSVAAAERRVQSARSSRRALGSPPATQLFVGYSDQPATGATDDDLALAQPIDLFGRVAASRASGTAALALAEAELRLLHAELQTEVVEQYSEVAASQALAESAAQSREIARKLYEGIKVLVNEGQLPGVQLTRVSIELERANLTADQRAADLQAGIQRLSGLLSVPPGQLAVSGFAELDTPTVDVESLPTSRAELLVLAAEVQSARAEARIANLGNRPELELQARRTPWQEKEVLYGLRLQLSIPIFDFGRTRAETRAAVAMAEASERAFDDAVRQAQSELEAARIELASARDQIERYQSMVKSARSLVEASTTGFIERAVTLLEVLEATRALREVEEGYIEARLRLAKSQAAYLRASGQIIEVPN